MLVKWVRIVSYEFSHSTNSQLKTYPKPSLPQVGLGFRVFAVFCKFATNFTLYLNSPVNPLWENVWSPLLSMLLPVLSFSNPEGVNAWGFLCMNWATDRVKSANTTSYPKGTWVKGNTPDLMLQHLYVLKHPNIWHYLQSMLFKKSWLLHRNLKKLETLQNA